MTDHARPGSPTSLSADPAEHARAVALSYLNHSPRSSGQLRSKLIAKDVDPDIADQIVQRYRDVGLLDDAALAEAIVRTRHKERGQARRAIAQELRRKEFDPEVIDTALAQIDDDDEYGAARELALKRWNSLQGIESAARTRRVVGMLGRKGYGPSVAFAVVKELSRADTESIDMP